MSYSVARRRREFGVRLAIGANRSRIVQMMLRETATVGIFGLLCAAPFIYAAGRLIQSRLYGVSADDPGIVSMAAALLLLTSVLAGVIPAATAARTDPYVALRSE